MMISPLSSSGMSDSMTASTGPPALTMIMTLRGEARDWTKPSNVCSPTIFLSGCFPTNSSVTAVVRL